MELKNFFKNSSNKTYTHNMDLLEHYNLVNPFGSPNKLFLKFLNSKNLNIKDDAITDDLIEEFESSVDSTNLKLAKIKKEKEIILKNQNVWINICEDNEWIGSDLAINSDNITIKHTNQSILYADMESIEVVEGGWSKKKFIIKSNGESIIFEINEDKAVPLKEIIEENISNQNYDEINELLDLYTLFEEGKISEDELEVRKAIIYSDDMYCTNCGAKIDLDSEFCNNCGNKII